MRSRLTWRPATVVDAIGGAVVSVVSVVLIAWLIASAVAYAPFPLISRQVNDSAVLRGVDRIMPPAASTMFSDFRGLLARGPYAQVFGALGAEGALSVAPPDNSVLSAGGLRRARRSIVKVQGTAPGCSRRIEGSGFVYARDRVLTNAHVVAGVKPWPEVSQQGGPELRARVVLYDPERDVAILYVPGLAARPLRFAGLAPAGRNAIVAGYPLDSSFTAVAARIGGSEAARSPDIYQTTQVTREIYSVRAVVRPGQLRRPAARARWPGLRRGVRRRGVGAGHRVRPDGIGGRPRRPGGPDRHRPGLHPGLRRLSGPAMAGGDAGQAGPGAGPAVSRMTSWSGGTAASPSRSIRSARSSADRTIPAASIPCGRSPAYPLTAPAPRRSRAAAPVAFPRCACVRPTATWARPCHRSRSAGSAAFHDASSTSCARNGRP